MRWTNVLGAVMLASGFIAASSACSSSDSSGPQTGIGGSANQGGTAGAVNAGGNGGASNTGGKGGTSNTGGNGGTSNSGGSSGTSSTGGTGNEGGTGGSGTDVCGTCIETACASQIAACEANADCVALMDCYDACTDSACYDNCYNQHAEGGPIEDKIYECECTSCASQCPDDCSR